MIKEFHKINFKIKHSYSILNPLEQLTKVIELHKDLTIDLIKFVNHSLKIIQSLDLTGLFIFQTYTDIFIEYQKHNISIYINRIFD